MESIKDYFGVGRVALVILENNTKAASYKVLSVTNLINVVIPHFEKYPLISQKKADYLLWKEAIQILANKEHLNQKGIEKLLALRSSLNLGLSPSLKTRFPGIIPVARPKVEIKNIPNPIWILGFTEGEGCFLINKHKASSFIEEKQKGNTKKLEFTFWLEFSISQHNRDRALLEQIRVYLDCGNVYPKHVATKNFFYSYRIARFDDISTKVIPFFQKYPLIGEKNKNFQDWCIAADIIKRKEHLTESGMEKLTNLKENMNKGRK